jgi:gentisate 1,2-dioxygenase
VTRIDVAVQEALDSISDDEEYAPARAELEAALSALKTGTTADAHGHLEAALRLIDETCPI